MTTQSVKYAFMAAEEGVPPDLVARIKRGCGRYLSEHGYEPAFIDNGKGDVFEIELPASWPEERIKDFFGEMLSTVLTQMRPINPN